MCVRHHRRTMRDMGNDDRTSNQPSTRPALPLRRWMQVTGAFYLAQFVMMVIVRAPIRTFGPSGTLAKADDGDALARFVIDTWTIFGLEVLAVGVVLLLATRRGRLAPGAIYTVLAIEISRGIIADLSMIARGVHVSGYLVWIVIHSTVIATGVLVLRAAHHEEVAPVRAPAHAST